MADAGTVAVAGEGTTLRPALDTVMPEAWQAAQAFSSAIRDAASARGLSAQEAELIKVRASQLNVCVLPEPALPSGTAGGDRAAEA